jgi:hypothetical protein
MTIVHKSEEIMNEIVNKNNITINNNINNCNTCNYCNTCNSINSCNTCNACNSCQSGYNQNDFVQDIEVV